MTGENPERLGLNDTPKRFLKAMLEHTEGYQKDPKDVLGVSFDLSDAHEGAVYDQIILSGPLPFSSLCEHHLAPFEGVAWIGYLPGEEGRVVGLSKLARVLDIFAKRLQVQERLTVQIADSIQQYLNPAGVGVMIRSRHLCQCHRGVKKEGRMLTSIMRGKFHDPSVKAEFLELVKLSE
jgi:GTP cyclohydrolase I